MAWDYYWIIIFSDYFYYGVFIIWKKYSLIPFMLFFSSLATGSVIGLLITPIAYFYEKIKKEESNDKKLFR